MKVITWNVRGGNRKFTTLLSHALDQQADIICLQEVPGYRVDLLKTIPSYRVFFTYDLKSTIPSRSRFTCILSRSQPVRIREIRYNNRHRMSLWERVIYRSILHTYEYRSALAVEVVSKTHKTIRFVSTRLPMSVGTNERIRLFSSIVSSLDHAAINIICGDLNIVDGRLINIVTGWLRGFKLVDYLTNERKRFELMLSDFGFINIFRGVATWAFKLPFFQFDHILVPRGIAIKQAYASPKRFGSDHRMLVADLVV